MICSCASQSVGSRARKQLATATLPGSGSWARVRPNSRDARAQEAVGELDQDAGAVAGGRVGARGAAMLEVVERRQRQVDDVVAGWPSRRATQATPQPSCS